MCDVPVGNWKLWHVAAAIEGDLPFLARTSTKRGAGSRIWVCSSCCSASAADPTAWEDATARERMAHISPAQHGLTQSYSPSWYIQQSNSPSSPHHALPHPYHSS